MAERRRADPGKGLIAWPGLGINRAEIDLVDTGYLRKTRVGRRNHYEIDETLPLRHLETAHRHLGELLALLTHTKPSA